MPSSFEYAIDNAWIKPMVDTGNNFRFKGLTEQFYNQGLLCRTQQENFIFIDTSNSWCNLASHEAMARIVDVAEMKNVSVSQDRAMRPLSRWLIKRCNSRVTDSVPVSICVGTRRFELDIDESARTIKFVECRPLLHDISAVAHPGVSQICIMPIDFSILPVSFSFPGEGTVLNYIGKLFTDDRDLVTFMWHVGNCVLDPVSRPRTLMLVGPGGTGKSTLMNLLMNCLVGCCSIIPNGSLTTTRDEMTSDVADAVSSSRMTICVDVDLEKHRLNMSVFKNISGSDYIRIGYNYIKTNCSLTIGTNDLVNTDEEPSYLSDAIMRRVVTVHMNIDALTVPYSAAPETSQSRLDFICACVYVRSRYDSIPARPYTVLLTLCNAKMSQAVEVIEETDEAISAYEGHEVILLLSYMLNIPSESVTSKARLISPFSVFSMNGVSYLRGLRPVRK